MKKYKVKPVFNYANMYTFNSGNVTYKIYQRFLYIFYIDCNGKRYDNIEEAVEVCEKLNKLS